MQQIPKDLNAYSLQERNKLLRQLVTGYLKRAKLIAVCNNDYYPVSNSSIGEKCNLSDSSVSKILTGAQIPLATTFIDFIYACGCNLVVLSDNERVNDEFLLYESSSKRCAQ